VSAPDGSGQLHALSALPPGRRRTHSTEGGLGSNGRSGHAEEKKYIFPLQGIKSGPPVRRQLLNNLFRVFSASFRQNLKKESEK
jgi:hypothetical protein